VRVYDGYGQISQETVSVSGTTVSQWNRSWDGAGRRSALNWQLAAQGGGAGSQYAMQYNGAGLLTQVTNSGSAYQFDYADNGLLQKRTTPLWTQTIVSRDGQGRVLSESVSARGITPVSETLTWRNDSRINSHAVVYSGSGALAPSESRTYGYDPRGRVVSEPFKLSGSQQSASYYFDQSAPGGAGSEGGLGVRTLQIFGGSYGYEVEAQNNFKQVTQDLNAPPGTAYSIVNQGYDALGSGTSRAIVNGQTQTLTWDGLGRLVSVKSRNASNNGNDWASVYDGLGRRVKTTQQTVTGGNPTGGISTLVYYYDPQVEFLQLGMSNQGVRTWNVYGPDANGVYGGQQGTGGLEAQVDETTGATTGMLGNYFGDVVGTVTSSNLSIPAIALGGYGPMPGSGVSSLAPAWRGRYLDWTGFYWMGARYYEPASGRFLSADPLGHGASMSLYDYANGDPVNGLDPDGRFGKMVGNGTKTDLGYGYDILNNVFYGTLAGGFKLAGAVDVGMQSGGATFDPQYSQWNQVAQAMESKYNLAEKAGWYTNNNLTAAVQNTATMVLPIFAGRFIPENPTLTGVGGTVDEAAGGSQLVVHQEQIIMNNYQRYYNDAWMQTVKRFNNGEITIPAGQSWQTTLGQYTDAAARARLQNYLQSAGIAEGPGTNVLVNRWLRDPSGSGAYRIPDVRLIQTGNILDGTIGNKTLLSPQVQDFIKFSNGNSVIIIRPTVGAGFGGG
jgi:RHS repeat-associated protein